MKSKTSYEGEAFPFRHPTKLPVFPVLAKAWVKSRYNGTRPLTDLPLDVRCGDEWDRVGALVGRFAWAPEPGEPEYYRSQFTAGPLAISWMETQDLIYLDEIKKTDPSLFLKEMTPREKLPKEDQWEKLGLDLSLPHHRLLQARYASDVEYIRDPGKKERERAAKAAADRARDQAARLERERVKREKVAAAEEAKKLKRESVAKKKAEAKAAAKAASQEQIRLATEKAVQEALAARDRMHLTPPTPSGGGGGGGSGGSEPPKKQTLPVPPPMPARSFSVHASLTKVFYRELRFLEGGKLGEGGFGVVYQGRWRGISVAIKQLRLDRLTVETQKSFEHETQVMFSLRHPNITQLLAVCVEPGHFCMVMEYLSKGSLFFVLHDEKEPLGWTMKYKIATQVAGALVALHSKGIVHRDLKSHNVLLDDAYNAKLSDFGLAKVKTETASTSTMGSLQGTVAWMAPECFTLRPQITNKTDIHSFGILLWELLTRQSPFEGVAQAILITHLAAGATEVIPEDAPTELKKLIEACWRREPVERPEATAVFETLSELSLAAEAEEAAAPKEPGPKTVAIDALCFRVAHLERGAADKDSLIPPSDACS